MSGREVTVWRCWSSDRPGWERRLVRWADGIESIMEFYDEPPVFFDPTPCACGCGRPLGDDECANERGEPSGVRAECWASFCANEASIAEDRAVDRAQERELWREWGGR